MDDYIKFQTIAIKFLSYRPRSEKEVREKLQKFTKKTSYPYPGQVPHSSPQRTKGSGVAKAPQNNDVIEQVMAFLKEQKFIDDAAFVKWWIQQRTEYKPKSLKVIKLELRQKGISNDLIDSMIHDSQFMIQSDVDRAKALVEKKLPKYKGLSRYELLQKLGPYLARRGFDYDTIKQSIDAATEEEV